MIASKYGVAFTSEGKKLFQGEVPSTIVQDSALRAVEDLVNQMDFADVLDDVDYFYTKECSPTTTFGMHGGIGENAFDVDLFTITVMESDNA